MLSTTGKHGASSTMIRCEDGRPARRDEWHASPDASGSSGPDRVAVADWDTLWTAVESTDWRTLLDCQSGDGSPYDSWSLEISDSAGRRTFRGRGSRFDVAEPCRSLVRAIDAQISRRPNRL